MKIFVADFIENEPLNNFKFIRLVAAFMVIVAHSYGFTKERGDPLFRVSGGAIDLSFLGLAVFFFLSGLLVTQSLMKSSSLKNFLWKRIVRLYPAAWLAIAVCMFVIGPLVTTLSLKDYFTDPLFYGYGITFSLIKIAYYLPGVFANSVMEPGINASLWSISLEWKLYAGLLLLFFLPVKNKRFLIVALIAGVLCINAFFYTPTEATISNLLGRSFKLYPYVAYTPYFLAGILCYLFKQKVFINRLITWMSLLLACAGIAFEFFFAIQLIILPVLVLCAAAAPFKWIKAITPNPDLSYGFYVFAFPVQQLIGYYCNTGDFHAWQMALFSIGATLPLAIFSWYFVERKALAYKNIIP